jgi:hypothetical protein
MSQTLHTEKVTETQSKGGPRTQAGKAASSRNSFKHGLASGRILIEGEDPAAFEALVADLEADYRPATETEALLVHDLAKFHWLADRAIRLQAEAFATSAWPEMPASLNVLLRYQTSSPPVQQTDAGSKTQRTNESARIPDHPEVPSSPSKGKKAGRANRYRVEDRKHR